MYFACDIMRMQMQEKVENVRASTKMDRLESLAVMNTNKVIEIDYQDLAKKSVELHQQKLNQNNLIYI